MAITNMLVTTEHLNHAEAELLLLFVPYSHRKFGLPVIFTIPDQAMTFSPHKGTAPAKC